MTHRLATSTHRRAASVACGLAFALAGFGATASQVAGTGIGAVRMTTTSTPTIPGSATPAPARATGAKTPARAASAARK